MRSALCREELKATRDQAAWFAAVARRRMRGMGGGVPRNHPRAVAQRVEIAGREVRIIGSQEELLRVPAAAKGAEPAEGIVTCVPEWRTESPPYSWPPKIATNQNRLYYNVFYPKASQSVRKCPFPFASRGGRKVVGVWV